MNAPDQEPGTVRLQLRAPGRPGQRRTIAAADLPVTLRHLDWSGPITVTVGTADGVHLAMTADGQGGWRAVWFPGIEGVPQVATSLPGGTDDVFRAFASQLSGGLASALAWQDAPAEVPIKSDLEAWETGQDQTGLEAETPRPTVMVSPIVIVVFLVTAALVLLGVAWAMR